jgi:cell division protein FtsB
VHEGVADDRVTEKQIAGIEEALTQLKTEAERLKKEIVELSGEDAAMIG